MSSPSCIILLWGCVKKGIWGQRIHKDMCYEEGLCSGIGLCWTMSGAWTGGVVLDRFVDTLSRRHLAQDGPTEIFRLISSVIGGGNTNGLERFSAAFNKNSNVEIAAYTYQHNVLYVRRLGALHHVEPHPIHRRLRTNILFHHTRWSSGANCTHMVNVNEQHTERS